MKKTMTLPLLLLLAACGDESDCVRRAEHDGLQACTVANHDRWDGGPNFGVISVVQLNCAGQHYQCGYRDGQLRTLQPNWD